jgi:hypothetical protein
MDKSKGLLSNLWRNDRPRGAVQRVRRDARAIRGVARIAFSVVGCRLQDLRGNRWVPEDRMAKSVRNVRGFVDCQADARWDF